MQYTPPPPAPPSRAVVRRMQLTHDAIYVASRLVQASVPARAIRQAYGNTFCPFCVINDAALKPDTLLGGSFTSSYYGEMFWGVKMGYNPKSLECHCRLARVRFFFCTLRGHVFRRGLNFQVSLKKNSSFAFIPLEPPNAPPYTKSR